MIGTKAARSDRRTLPWPAVLAMLAVLGMLLAGCTQPTPDQGTNVFGLLGLALIVFAIAVWKLNPDWSALWNQASHPSVPQGEGHPTYWYYK